MKRSAQDGYALLAVLLFLSVVVISLAAAMPGWKTAIQREREARSIDHAREYRTAIRRYFHKNGRYPASLDILSQKDGNGIRYLRQPFADPLAPAAAADAGSAQSAGWEVIHFGQAVNAEIVDQPPKAATGLGGGAAVGAGAPTLPGLTGGGAPSPPAPSGPGAGIGGGPVIGVASLNKQPAVHAFNGFDIPNQWQFVYNYTLDPTLRTGGAPGAPLAPGAPVKGTPVGAPPPGPGH